ncbi:MAG: hypothetical protein K2X66_09755, partial [Cyanobacteria bacterium]|nr:hypothetical protein [Cyanobacteriota bacterium]
NSFFTELKSKTHLIISQDKSALEGPNQKLATIHHTPDQGIMEEMISPWNEKRVALLLFGQTDQALQRLGTLFQNDKLFGQIPSSVNLVMMNEEGPKGLQVIKKGEARFFNPADFGAEGGFPFWTMIVVGIFAFLGLISVIRFFFGR